MCVIVIPYTSIIRHIHWIIYFTIYTVTHIQRNERNFPTVLINQNLTKTLKLAKFEQQSVYCTFCHISETKFPCTIMVEYLASKLPADGIADSPQDHITLISTVNQRISKHGASFNAFISAYSALFNESYFQKKFVVEGLRWSLES